MNTFEDVLKYLYIVNVSYPPPQLVILKFDKSVNKEHYLIGKFYRACAKLINMSTADILYKLNYNDFEPNLILNAKQIKFMFDNDLLPDIKVDTTVV